MGICGVLFTESTNLHLDYARASHAHLSTWAYVNMPTIVRYKRWRYTPASIVKAEIFYYATGRRQFSLTDAERPFVVYVAE